MPLLDNNTIAVTNRPENNRLNSLTNALTQPGVKPIFFIPGVNKTLRINGKAEIYTQIGLLIRFDMRGKLPLSSLAVMIGEAYLHRAKALICAQI